MIAGHVPKHYSTLYKGNTEAAKGCAKVMRLNERVELSVGAQVILTYNKSIDEGLINGSRGVVVGLKPKSVDVQFVNHREVISIGYRVYVPEGETGFEISYIPLKLGWAVSIHASQGMTLDALEIDLGSSIFACGQAYTGLSRARNMKSVRIVDVLASSFRTHCAVTDFYA